jgi:5-methylcytosine-specific restriction endonuclease McrA
MPKLKKNHDRGSRDWYQKQRWRNRAKHQLRVEPLCRLCLQRGIVTAATVCDHVQPHRGGVNKFWLGELQSLCKPCHDRDKKFLERRGYLPDVGPDGWPLDPRHPVYQAG